MKWVNIVALTAVLGAAAGCGSTDPGTTTSATGRGPAAAGSASSPGSTGCDGFPGARPVAWSDADGPAQALVYATTAASHADTAVVVSNQSDQMRCSWGPYLTLLRRRGNVWLYDYNDSRTDHTGVADVTAVTRQAVTGGARQVILVGASKGAKASLVAGVTLQPAPQAVIALSPEANLADGTPVLGKVTGATYPTLIAVADDDPYQAAPASHALAAARSAGITLFTVPGTAHGTALLAGPTAAPVSNAINQFLDQHPG